MPLQARGIGIGQHAVDVDDSARQNLGALDTGRTDGDLQNFMSKAETIFLGMLTQPIDFFGSRTCTSLGAVRVTGHVPTFTVSLLL
jgi:hypothetical protein